MMAKGRTPMYKAIDPAVDSPKTYRGTTKNINEM